MTYLESAIKEFKRYKQVAESAMDQLQREQLFESFNEESNSIAVIVNHLSGNMLSRWTDFLTTDGEKEWRNRDREFEHVITDKEELLKKWNQGWSCLFSALQSLSSDDLAKTVFIRKEPHSVVEAINRQLAHYPYHIGQIVFAAKILKKGEWNTLSIARNKSEDFNKQMFSK